MRPFSAPLATFATLALLTQASAQTTWYVDASAAPPGDGTLAQPYVHIQDAIGRPTTLDGDTLSVAPGTYRENIDFLGKAIRVVSAEGPAVTVLEALGSGAVVRFAGGETTDAVLEGFGVSGGLGETLPDEPFLYRGGGVFIDGASPTLRDCRISGNGSLSPIGPGTDSGGGIFVRDGSPWIDGCAIEGNVCWQYGGGIDIRGTSFPVIVDSSISFNRVGYGGVVYGGGIHFATADPLALPLVLDSRIEGNTATRGGGVYGPVELRECEIVDNTSVFGGGAYGVRLLSLCTLRGNVASNDTVQPWICGSGGGAYESTLIGCTVEGNSSCHGAGIASCTAEDTLFSGNVADDLTGSAFAVAGGAAHRSTLLRCTLIGNSTTASAYPEPSDFVGGALSECTAERCELRDNVADEGGGAYASDLVHCTVVGNVAREEGGGVFGGTLLNSIVWLNEGGDADTTVAATYSLVGGGAPGAGNLDLDPKLWGPVTGDLRLTPASPCIDAGDPATEPDPDDGSTADLGATPFSPAYVGEPRSYCEAKVSSQGCTPAISSVGTPSLGGSDDFRVVATNVRPGSPGIFFWGRAARNAPFAGGTLCIDGTAYRRAVANSGTPGACSGVFDRAFPAQYLASRGVSAWDTIYVQCWYRDQAHPDGTGVGLTDALEVTVLP